MMMTLLRKVSRGDCISLSSRICRTNFTVQEFKIIPSPTHNQVKFLSSGFRQSCTLSAVSRSNKLTVNQKLTSSITTPITTNQMTFIRSVFTGKQQHKLCLCHGNRGTLSCIVVGGLRKNYWKKGLHPVYVTRCRYCDDKGGGDKSKYTLDPKADTELQKLMNEIFSDFETATSSNTQHNSDKFNKPENQENVNHESEIVTRATKNVSFHDEIQQFDKVEDFSHQPSDDTKIPTTHGGDSQLEFEEIEDFSRQRRVDPVRDPQEFDYPDVQSDDYVGKSPLSEKMVPIGLKRGKRGVYDLHELVAVLKSEQVDDLCVIKIPKQHNYVDYMVIVSMKSAKQLKAVAQWVKWVYKRKKSKKDPDLVIEGKGSNEWIAIDFGNIVLHMFKPDVREFYDLESLWSYEHYRHGKMNTEDLCVLKTNFERNDL